MEKIMGEYLYQFISSAFGVTVAATIGILLLAFWVTKQVTKILIEHKALKKNQDKIENNIDDIRQGVSYIRGAIELLIQSSPTNRRAAKQFSSKHSPRVLNPAGLSIYNDINGEEFLTDNKKMLFASMDLQAPKTPLDVEDAARSALIANVNTREFDTLKNWVYNAPSREIEGQDGEKRMVDVALSDVLFVLSLPLRDMYLNDHPEILRQ